MEVSQVPNSCPIESSGWAKFNTKMSRLISTLLRSPNPLKSQTLKKKCKLLHSPIKSSFSSDLPARNSIFLRSWSERTLLSAVSEPSTPKKPWIISSDVPESSKISSPGDSAQIAVQCGHSESQPFDGILETVFETLEGPEAERDALRHQTPTPEREMREKRQTELQDAEFNAYMEKQAEENEEFQ